MVSHLFNRCSKCCTSRKSVPNPWYVVIWWDSGCTRGDQKVRGKVLLNRIAFIDCNENS